MSDDDMKEDKVLDASVIDWWNHKTHLTIAKGILEPWDEEDESGNVPFKIVTGSLNLKDGITMDGFFLMFKGYGDAHSGVDHGAPILIEIDKGALRVVVWSDINHEDSTHSVSLRDALESNWKGEEQE